MGGLGEVTAVRVLARLCNRIVADIVGGIGDLDVWTVLIGAAIAGAVYAIIKGH